MYTVLWLGFLYCDWGSCTVTEVLLTLTEVFPCFFLSCKANARVKLAKTGHGPHSTTLVVFVLFGCYLCYSMYFLCVNVYCHRVTTQLQLINISMLCYFSCWMSCTLKTYEGNCHLKASRAASGWLQVLSAALWFIQHMCHCRNLPGTTAVESQ